MRKSSWGGKRIGEGNPNYGNRKFKGRELEILKMYDGGLSAVAIARKLKCWRGTIEKVLKEMGIKRIRRADLQHNSRWNGGTFTDKRGYVYQKDRSHPGRNSHNYVQVHRLVMEEIIGRPLKKEEIVHHKNGVKNDNRPKNLEIKLRSNHHGEIICPYCDNKFLLQ